MLLAQVNISNNHKLIIFSLDNWSSTLSQCWFLNFFLRLLSNLIRKALITDVVTVLLAAQNTFFSATADFANKLFFRICCKAQLFRAKGA
jgi:hypothetical protein